MKQFYTNGLVAILLATSVTPFQLSVGSAQTEKDRNNSKATTSVARAQAPRELGEWQALLDDLAVQARNLDPEQERPSVMAEIADIYWNIDKARSGEFFVAALDSALALPQKDKRTKEAIQKVLLLASRRDRALAQDLTKRLAQHGNQALGNSLRVARDLLESDPEMALELAKSAARLGPSMSGSWFIFKLAETNPAGAQQLYEAYFNNLVHKQNLDLASILFLAGYPLGYGEAYGGSKDPAELTGFGGLPVSGLAPNPRLAVSYLNLALASVHNTLRLAAAAPDLERDTLNSLSLFTIAYLSPEIGLYLPALQSQWSSLYQQALSGTTNTRRINVETRLQTIIETRARARTNKSPEETASESSEDKLAAIEKLPGGCQRDRAYAQVVFALVHAKEFDRVAQIADKINSASLRDEVKQFLNYDKAYRAVEADDLNLASELVEKVTAKDQRAILYMKIAVRALKKSDKSKAIELLHRSRSLVRDPADPKLQAGVLLAAAGVYSQFDPLEASSVMRDAIKAVNRLKEQNQESFAVLLRVNLSCGPGDERWYGASEQAETISLNQTLAVIAASELQPEGALSLSNEIDDRVTRIRAQLSVIKAATKSK